MTASVLVYARGGGHGHAMRAAELAAALLRLGLAPTLLVDPQATAHLPAGIAWRSDAAVLKEAFDWLVVDTFPRGLAGELCELTRARFAHRVLVARASSAPGILAAHEHYHRVLSPYPAAQDEWHRPLAGARHTGWLVRPAPMRIEPAPRFVVLDPTERMPAALLESLARHAMKLGLATVRLTRFCPLVEADKVLSIGAGYNTVYELAATPADLRFYPLRRRYDDQAARARLVGRSAGDLEAVCAWLEAPVDRRAFSAQGRYTDATLAEALGLDRAAMGVAA